MSTPRGRLDWFRAAWSNETSATGVVTQHIHVNLEDFDAAVLEAPARCVQEGGLVAFPTETVYGIAANRDHPQAVRRLLDLRGSPDEREPEERDQKGDTALMRLESILLSASPKLAAVTAYAQRTANKSERLKDLRRGWIYGNAQEA